MTIQITPKKSDGVERLLQVSVPVETVRAAEERAATRYASSARLPGFRPGKAPAAMIRKRYADDIRKQALETLVQEAYQEAIDREKLQPVAQPHVHDLKYEEGQPLTFELHVEVRPDVKLEKTDGFTITRQPTAVSDEQVREQLEALRDQRALLTPVTEGKPQPGDKVTVMLAIADESGAIPEGKEYPLDLGSGQAIAAIEELIMEAEVGQTVERMVRWPDDFPNEDERGKSKLARVELKDVKRKAAPELDDAFAREVGDFDSLDALTTAVRADMTSHAERESEAAVRQQLIDEIVAANPFEIPGSWVQQLVGAYADAYQIPEADRATFAGEFRQMAERQVRRDLIVDAIAEQEKLAATEADVDERVAEVATQRGAEPGQVYASLQKAGRLREIERSITEDKVFSYLTARNTVA